MSTTNDNNAAKTYDHIEEDKNLQYCICEQNWKDEHKEEYDKLNATYGNYCVTVPDGFFQLVDDETYKMQLTPLAKLWMDMYGSTYTIDAAHGEGYFLDRVGEDKGLGTTADYWMLDKRDVRLTAAIDDLAGKIGEAIDKLPFEKVETRGRKKKVAEDAEEQDESTTPGTPKYIAKERNKIMGKYKDILEKRYTSYAGYDRDRIVQRIKGMAAKNAVKMNDLKRTGSLVPCLNGVYDMRTQVFRSAVASDYISAYAPTTYVKGAKDGVVTKFLGELTCGRKDLQDFLARVMGVALDKNMLTRTMCQLLGPTTTNGKSTFVKAMTNTLGEVEEHGLAVKLSSMVIGKSRNSNDDTRVTPSLAMIGDAKVIFASEPKKGVAVDCALLKQLTSGDTITVNRKHKDAESVEARAKMIMDTNHPLRIDDDTVFARGTMQIVPCDFVVKVKDTELDAKLFTDSARSAWMSWMIEGYVAYVKNGNNFDEPDCVKEALEKNKLDNDRIGRFFLEPCVDNRDAAQKWQNKIAQYH